MSGNGILRFKQALTFFPPLANEIKHRNARNGDERGKRHVGADPVPKEVRNDKEEKWQHHQNKH